MCKQRGLFAVLIFVIVFGSVHCGRGDYLTEADPSTITILYPGTMWEMNHCEDGDLRLLVFLPMVVRNENEELEGRLAEHWEHSADYRNWMVHLCKDIRWHDGIPVTAHDVKFTLDLMTHPNVAWLKPEDYSITVLDDYTYKITHKFGLYFNLMDDWRVYYPKHLLENLDPKDICDWEFWNQPVGNGPFRFVRLVPKTLLELEANPDYYRGKPRIERVLLKFGENITTELLSGNVDAAVYVKQIDIMNLRDDPRFRVYHELTGIGIGIIWNQKYQKFRDPRVRQALTMAINRREMLRMFDLPDSLPIFDVVHDFNQFLRKELPDPLPYNPEQSKNLLDEVGWQDEDGDGVREKGGREFRFTVITSSGYEKGAVYVQEQLKEIGILMDVRTLEYFLTFQRMRAGDFEALFHLFPNDVVEFGYFGKDSPIGYHNPRIDGLLDAYLNTLNPNEKNRAMREIWLIFQREIPVTFLYPRVHTTISHRRVRGLSPLHSSRANPILNLENLWIEEEKEERQ